MNIIYGLALLAFAIAMTIWEGRVPGWTSAPFLKVWIVGQAYAMTIVIAFVLAAVFLIGI